MSQQSLYRVVFHPVLKNVMAVSGDSGEIKVYRFEYLHDEFKIQCAATLIGHNANSRPLCFNTEVPWMLSSGSWDGSVIVWNWVTQEALYKYQLESDVYGLA